jgi:aminomethyltransferase
MPLRTPLYDWHVAHGARLVDFAGWEMPIQYTSIVEEHQAVRTGAGLFDISHMGRLSFEGPDALDLIQHVYTNDVASMKPGQARYGLICNEQGGILDDVVVYRFEPFWLMVVNASNREKIVSWIATHRGSRQVRVIDRTASWAMVAVQGRHAAEVMAGEGKGVSPLPDGSQGRFLELKYYYAASYVQRDGSALSEPCIVSRTGYTGEDGFEIIVSASAVGGLVDGDLLNRAKQARVELKPCGLGARDTLRLEAAMPLYGHELTEAIDPFEAGLNWAVKMEKGDFIGREALTRRQQQPNRPRRVGLGLEGRRIAREGGTVVRDGANVGRVTSGTFSPTLDQSIAMAYVDAGCSAPGTQCEVDIRGKPVAARVIPLPFYDRKRKA